MNSSLNSVDKGISLYDAINILIHKDLEELLIWDEQEGDWIWMLTLVDAIRFITHALKSLLRHDFVGSYEAMQIFGISRRKSKRRGRWSPLLPITASMHVNTLR